MLLLSVMLGACAVATKPVNLEAEQSIQSAIEANEFRRADSAYQSSVAQINAELNKIQTKVSQLKERDKPLPDALLARQAELQRALPELEAVGSAMRAESSVYTENSLLKVESAKKLNDWREADRQLIELERRVLASKRLVDYRTQFDEERQLALANLEHRLLMLESRQLPERETIYRALAKTGYGEASLYARLRSEQDQKNRVESSLRERAMRAERENNLSTALQYLTALARLDPSQEVQADVNRVKNWLAASSPAVVKKPASPAPRKKVTFEKPYGEALAAEDWIRARQLLDKELAKRPRDSELKAQDAYLDDKFEQLVESAKADAEAKYTSGEIEEALSIWQDAQAYAPEDITLITNIQRATKILQKLETLQASSE